MSAVAFDGSKVVLKPERWQHIVLRHSELKSATELILDTIAHPDEVYIDPTGAYHALKRVKRVSDYLVVIYNVGDEGYIRTAYYTSNIRKMRRYRSFRKLKPS
jgi:hypothetical protein